MLGVTERAKQMLLQKRLSAGISDPTVGWRLVSIADGAFTLVADRVRAGDQVVEDGGSMVLLVDAELSEILLAGRTVDYGENADGRPALFLRAPRVRTTLVPAHLRPRRKDSERRRMSPPAGRGPSPPTTAA